MNTPDDATPEFRRMADIRAIDTRPLDLVATATECAALARRFGILSVGSLTATVELVRDGHVVNATGRVSATVVQACAVSGNDLPITIEAPLAVRFVPESTIPTPSTDTEIELDADDLDDIPYTGTSFDVGEAVAQTLALAIDPFATGPEAENVRESGVFGGGPVSPFAALAALKGKVQE